ncbi:hypothetical protein [Desulfolutivibrio sulfoxidireducens]|uniref:hypothetical protein n=1 Tax=Desulfolutivibrio sulfoxidireducens TaxID=2773299 RepID=UPI00159D10EE|nr:hypothetical protein [Desulfolutivibrio sulfoxidireducens]QLA19440.1 hypothetical protein GD604_06630 [Desulfolutivibrio sulfoxidireducens]
MKQGIRFLLFLLVAVVIPASPCSAQSPSPNIEIVPVSKTTFHIYDNRTCGPEITEVLANNSKSSLFVQLSSIAGQPRVYEAIYPDSLVDHARITVKSGSEVLLEKIITIGPSGYSEIRITPKIIQALPKRITGGQLLTIKGQYFGMNPDEITLFMHNYYPIKASFVSIPDKDMQQEAQFLIPVYELSKKLYDDIWLCGQNVPLMLETPSGGKKPLKSNWVLVDIVRDDAKIQVAWISFISIAIILIIIFFILKNIYGKNHSICELCKMMLSDKNTNTYSLSKLQALLWTVVVVWSYVFLALGKGVLTGEAAIPDFNASLLGLLGISYGGLITAKGLGNTHPKNDLAATEQKLSDFFSENNEISLTRLQLFVFTLVGVGIYVFYSFNPEFFNTGLPDIPTTLNGLFLVSQGGYIGGKLTGATVVNYLLPRRVKKDFKNEITLVGRGFTDNTKLLLQGTQAPIPTTFLNQNTLTFKLPDQPLNVGLKQIVVIPPTGSSFVVDNALEIIDITIQKTISTDSAADKVLDIDFSGIVLNREPLVARCGDTPLKARNTAANRYRIEGPDGLKEKAEIVIAASDGSFAIATTVEAGDTYREASDSQQGVSDGSGTAPGAPAPGDGKASDSQHGVSDGSPTAPGTPAPGDG